LPCANSPFCFQTLFIIRATCSGNGGTAYITWAKQYRFKNIKDEGKESWKAAWYLKLFEDVANKLSLTMADSTRFNDFEKAQLFIGYLASFPKSEPSAITTDNNNNDNNIGGSDNEQ
jgi:hypothetical protein